MGAWGNLPWDNDSGADWFGDMFEDTKLADRVEATLRLDPAESHEEIRAAASVVLLFGHTYVWPIKQIDLHLALAADRLEELLRLNIYAEAPDLVASIRDEIQELRSRIKAPSSATPQPSPVQKKWWQFWQ